MTDSAVIDYVANRAIPERLDTQVGRPALPRAVPRWFPEAPTVNITDTGYEVILADGRYLRDDTLDNWASAWIRLYMELCAKLDAGEHVSDFYARDFQKIEAHLKAPTSWGNPSERTCPNCGGKGTVPF